MTPPHSLGNRSSRSLHGVVLIRLGFIGVGFAAGVEQANNSFAGVWPRCVGIRQAFCRKVCGRTNPVTLPRNSCGLPHTPSSRSALLLPRLRLLQVPPHARGRLPHLSPRSDSGRTEPNYSFLVMQRVLSQRCPIWCISEGLNRGSAPGLHECRRQPSRDEWVWNLIREFLSRRLTTNATGDGNHQDF